MAKTLYICIDESGLHARGDCYTVAGCWHVSERTNPNDVLTPTKDRAIKTISAHNKGPRSISEIKGASLHPTTLNDVVQWLRNGIYEDHSILTSHTVWSLNIPLGFTFCSLNPDLAVASIAHMASENNTPQLIQLFSLNSVIAPLFHQETVDIRGCDSIVVILDDTTWKNTAERISTNIEQLDSVPVDISFEIRDSKSTPGIQFADLAAYSWQRNLRKGDCGTAAGILHDLRFYR